MVRSLSPGKPASVSTNGSRLSWLSLREEKKMLLRSLPLSSTTLRHQSPLISDFGFGLGIADCGLRISSFRNGEMQMTVFPIKAA